MAVTVDSEMVSNVAASATAVSSLTYSFSNTAGTYLAVAVLATNPNGGGAFTLSSVTYNSVAMTQYAATKEDWDVHAGPGHSLQAFYTLQSPATGSKSVVFTASATVHALISAAISVTGQATSAAEANGQINFSDSATTTSPAVSLTTVQSSSLCLGWYSHGSGIQTPTLDVGQVQSAFKDVDTSTAGSNSSLTRFTGSGTISPTEAVSVSDAWGVSAMEILASGAASQFPFDQRPNLVRF